MLLHHSSAWVKGYKENRRALLEEEINREQDEHDAFIAVDLAEPYASLFKTWEKLKISDLLAHIRCLLSYWSGKKLYPGMRLVSGPVRGSLDGKLCFLCGRVHHAEWGMKLPQDYRDVSKPDVTAYLYEEEVIVHFGPLDNDVFVVIPENFHKSCTKFWEFLDCELHQKLAEGVLAPG